MNVPSADRSIIYDNELQQREKSSLITVYLLYSATNGNREKTRTAEKTPLVTTPNCATVFPG